MTRWVGRSSVPGEARDERGAAAVEFAIIAPLFFLLVFAIIDFGFGFHAWDGTQNAAREGARVGAVTPDTGEIESRVRQSSSFLDQTVVGVSVQCAAEGSSSFGSCGWIEGDTVRVTVTYLYSYKTPLPTMAGFDEQLTMRSIAESRFEGV